MSAKPISAEAPIMRLCDEPFVDFLGFCEEPLNGETRTLWISVIRISGIP